MAKSYQAQTATGNQVPTTYTFDVSQLYQVEVTSPEFKELLVRLYQNINSMILALNIKDTGVYIQEEFLVGNIFFPNPALSSTTAQQPIYRNTYRTVVNFGALPNAGTKSLPHNILIVPPAAAGYSFVKIYGCATDPIGLTYIPLPFASPILNENIKLTVDAVFVNVTTVMNYSNYTISYIILEYIKS